mgnify:CR=1 FL=1
MIFWPATRRGRNNDTPRNRITSPALPPFTPAQAGRSLVVKAELAVTICARMDLDRPALGKIVQQAGG